MTPKKVHRYKAKDSGPAKGSWYGAQFIKDNYYGVAKLFNAGILDPFSVVVSGVFQVKDETIEKNLLIEKESCHKYLTHDPVTNKK